MDRRVYGTNEDGSEVVRYDRAGKWYLEKSGEARRKLSIKEAVEIVAGWEHEAVGGPRLGLVGGSRFDSLYIRHVKATYKFNPWDTGG